MAIVNGAGDGDDRPVKLEDCSIDEGMTIKIASTSSLCCGCCKQLITLPFYQCHNHHLVCAPCWRSCYKWCDCKDARSSCNKALETLLTDCSLSCPRGCDAMPKFFKLQEHLDRDCIRRPYICSIAGCKFSAAAQDLSSHIAYVHHPYFAVDLKAYSDCAAGRRFNLPAFSDAVTSLRMDIPRMEFLLHQHKIGDSADDEICCCLGVTFLGPIAMEAKLMCEVEVVKFDSRLVMTCRPTSHARNWDSVYPLLVPSGFAANDELNIQVCIKFNSEP